MIRLPFATLLLLCLLFPVTAALAQPEIVKDSVYFTLDDGVMSPEEMQEEAEYVYQICDRNPFQNKYFDCGCIAGAFLIQREKLGPMVMQDDIFNAVTSGPNARCANAPMIASMAYNNCLAFSQTHRFTEPDNLAYCECSANKAAIDFSKSPKLDTTYATSIGSNAMIYCHDPQNRKKFVRQNSSATLN